MSEFIAFCRSIGCHAIFQVPGEINSTNYAAAQVRYVEQNLTFFPDYWEIGNEPARWRHFNIPWNQWNWSQNSAATPRLYAEEVRNYIAAMRHVDPSIRIIGFPGDGRGVDAESSWLGEIARTDGASISAVGIHVYPAGLGPTSSPTLADFLGTLSGKASIPARVPADRAAMLAACPSCPSIPMFVTELGSAVLDGLYTPYVEGFPDAVYIGAEIIQAFNLNISNVDYFATDFPNPGSWVNGSEPARPVYQLYNEILGRLGPQTHLVNASGPVGGLYAVATERHEAINSTDFLFVNTNATSGALIAPGSISGLSGVPAETWSWNNTTSEPVASFWPSGLPANWTVPPVSLVLFESSGGNSFPVTYQESGFPSDHRWYLTVGNLTATTTTRQLTYFLPNGVFNVTVEPPLPYPGGGRLQAFTTSAIDVSSAPLDATISFVPQYHLSVRVLPSGGGSISPAAGWFNASSSLRFLATPYLGFSFLSWYGGGAASYTGALNPATITLSSNVEEVAVFGRTFSVTFSESGLPGGTVWSVVVRNVAATSSGTSLTIQEPNGTFAYRVLPIHGFRVHTATGVFAVAGADMAVLLTWSPAPALKFAVHLLAAGLPSSANWTLTINESRFPIQGDRWTWFALNGSYTFVAEPPLGYRANSSSGSFSVVGAPVTLVLFFARNSDPAQPLPPSTGGQFLPPLVTTGLVVALVATAVAVNLARRRFRTGPNPPAARVGDRLPTTPQSSDSTPENLGPVAPRSPSDSLPPDFEAAAARAHRLARRAKLLDRSDPVTRGTVNQIRTVVSLLGLQKVNEANQSLDALERDLDVRTTREVREGDPPPTAPRDSD